MTASQIKRLPLQFGAIQASGHEELAGASPLAVNVIVDAAGAVHRRPAITARTRGVDVVSYDGPIVALHSTAAGRLFAIDAPQPYSRIYELSGTSVINLSAASGGEVIGGLRPIVAETEAMLVITAGGPPQKVLLQLPAISSRLGGDPPYGSHVIAHASRLLINDVRSDNLNTIRYSGMASGSSIEGHESWTGDIEDSASASFFNADARPDPVVALHENTNDVFGFGTTNLQLFTAGTTTRFNYLPANARELGCSAPYSVVKYDQSFAFIDGYRRIVLSDGRDVQVLSEPIQQTLDDIDDLSDAFAYRVTLGAVDALCWGLPADGRTFVYQTNSKGWSIWQGWNDLTNNYAPLLVQCAIRVPETGEMLVGFTIVDTDQTLKGGVGVLSNSRYLDNASSVNNTKIVARVDTGFIDRTTSGRKLCRALRLTWRGTPSPDTAAWVQWRDDGGQWEHQRQIEIGPSSETILRSLGVYRRRQWRVIFEGQAELVLARAEEEFEPLAV